MKKVSALSAFACVALLSAGAMAGNVLDFDVVLDFEPAACNLTIASPQVNLGVIPFDSLPATGTALLDRETGYSWSAANGPRVSVDCNDTPVSLAFLVQDNQQHSLDAAPTDDRLGLGGFNDALSASIGYFQLLPENVAIDGSSAAANSLRTSADGSAWQQATDNALVTNRNGLINSWQAIANNSNGVSSLAFDLAGKVYLNGQDRVSEAGRSAVHDIQGSVTLTIVMF